MQHIALSSNESIDSLKHVLSKELSVEDRLQTLAFLTRDYRFQEDSSIKYGHILLNEAIELQNNYYVSSACVNLGQSFKDKGAYEIAAKYLLQALDAAKSDGLNLQNHYGLLGAVYGRLGDMQRSFMYFEKSIEWAEKHEYALYLKCISYNNLAEAYYQNGVFDSANVYFRKAYDIAYSKNYGARHLINGNIGMMNLKFGKLDSAEIQLKRVLSHLDPSSKAYLTFKILLGRLYFETGRLDSALIATKEVIRDSELLEIKEQVRDGLLLLSQIQKSIGDLEGAITNYETYVELKDELENVEAYARISNLQSEFDLAQKDAEIQVYAAEKKSRDVVLIVVLAFFVLLGGFVIVLMRQNRSKSRMNVQLTRQKGELEVLNQTKDKFFSIISHDLRGPVSAFYGVSRMIKFLAISNRTDELIEMADDISKSVDRLSSLLDNLLNWAMQQRGDIPNIPEKIILKTFVLEIVGSLKTLAESKNISLTCDIDDQMVIWADKNITSTIIRNLISNSLKFTPEGGQVSILVEEKNRTASIVIRDSGVGIPEYKLKTLFNGQSDESTYGTAGEKGLGLGLQLVHEFVGMIGGKISVESQINTGTSFKFTVPKYELGKELAEIH